MKINERLQLDWVGCQVAALAVIAVFGATTQAALLPSDFGFSIAAYEEVLFEVDEGVYVCGDPRHEMIAHSEPRLRLTNSSASTTFEAVELSIGDLDYHFVEGLGTGYLSTIDDVTVSFFNAAGDPSTGLTDQDIIRIDFGPEGLKPGESLTYRFKLGRDSGGTGSIWDLPDFREVLFANANDPMPPIGLTIFSDMIGMEESNFAIRTENTQELTVPIGYDRSGQGLPAVNPNFIVDPFDVPVPEPTAATLAVAALLAVAKRQRSR